jgi:hypothetical protein
MFKTQLLSITMLFALQSLCLSDSGESQDSTPYHIKGIKRIFFQKTPPVNNSGKIRIICFEHKDNPLYIGIQQEIIINAPVSRVISVFDNYDDFPNLYEEVISAKVISRPSDNSYTLVQEFKHPLIFMSNIKMTTSFQTSKNSQKEKRYLYKLISGNLVKFNDGVVILNEVNNSTHYFELSFVDGDLPIVGKLAHDTVWSTAVKDTVKPNLVLKLRSEYPDWSFKKINIEAENMLKSIDIKTIVKNKTLYKVAE